MGYCTEYEIEILEHEPINLKQEEAEAEHICSILEDVAGYGFEGNFDKIVVAEYEPVKWYEHDRHMKHISLIYPKLVFQLTGMGEEQPDMWRRFYRNGKAYYEEVKIIYPEFNEDKLE